jgi:hypothetical protein
MPKSEPGICVECGKSAECLNTSVGWMCRPCFHSAVKNGSKEAGDRVYTMPDPGEKVFVIMEPPSTYITIGGVLYAFLRRIEADEMSDRLRRGYGIKAFVEETEAILPLRYVLAHPELRLISIERAVEGKAEAGPGEISTPKL